MSTTREPAEASSGLRIGIHVGQLLDPTPGGTGRVTTLLCHELSRHARVVGFTAGSPRALRRVASALGSCSELCGLGWDPPRWRYEMWHRMRRPRVDLDLDICHAPSLAVPPTKAPLVVSINDLAFLRHPELFTRHGVSFHRQGLAIARREAAAIVTPSRFTCDELLREGFESGRVHHIPLSVGSVPEPDMRVTEREIQRAGLHDPYLLCVGTIEPRKDHATIVAAYDRLRTRHPSLSLVIAGPHGWLPPQDVSDLSRPGVRLLGHVSEQLLDALYRHAAVVVSASVYEGFGLTVLEALARGCAVVASDIPAHAELATGAARLFPVGDHNALTSELDLLLSNRAASEQLRGAAHYRAGAFTLGAMMRAHLDLYDSVMNGHS